MSFIPTNQELGLPDDATTAERHEAYKLASDKLQYTTSQRTQSGGYKDAEKSSRD